ncbi:hypothetical protein FRC02_001836 [Tulasnella sp. 418]|nr:hypothetical protein FRC02_001836 [Tulasnella sp. 418]
MVFSITLPDQYGYVALATASFFWLTQWQGLNVSKYRKLAKIPYPQAYADKAQQEASKEALQFNCAQRAHQNTLETLPIVMATTLFTGIKYPIFAASTALAWSFAYVPSEKLCSYELPPTKTLCSLIDEFSTPSGTQLATRRSVIAWVGALPISFASVSEISKR